MKKFITVSKENQQILINVDNIEFIAATKNSGCEIHLISRTVITINESTGAIEKKITDVQ